MQEFSKGETGYDVGKLQEFLFQLGFLEQQITSEFDEPTYNNVVRFQKAQKLPETGIVSPSLMLRMVKIIKGVKEADFVKTAKDLNVELAAIKAVFKVESGGFGFLANGKPKILFEGHRFWDELQNVGIDPKTIVSDATKSFLYPNWTSKYYRKDGIEEYELRLEPAMEIHREAALKAASFGAFQILGMNYKNCGYNSVDEYVNAMNLTEGEHLKAFGNLIKANKWLTFLQTKDWAGFAAKYNGAKYAENQYDIKLKNAYNEFKK